MMAYYSVLAVMERVLPVSFALSIYPKPYCTPGDCVEGEKKGTDGRCIPCDSGTFMPYRSHSCTSCYTCDSATLDIYHPNLKDIAAEFCIKHHECSDSENISRNCTETQNTLCIPNTTTSKAVPDDDETTNVRNDLSTSETANTMNETTVSPASNFSTTAPPEAGGDISTEVLIVFSVIGALTAVAVVIAALVIYKCMSRYCRSTNYHPTSTSQPDDTNNTELMGIENGMLIDFSTKHVNNFAK